MQCAQVYDEFLDIMKEFKAGRRALRLPAPQQKFRWRLAASNDQSMLAGSEGCPVAWTCRADTAGVIVQVKNLFAGHNELILGFNTFLPEVSVAP